MIRGRARSLALSAVLMLLAGGAAFFATTRWSATHSVLKQDGLAYFLYARSLVVDHDLDVTAEHAALDRHFNGATTEAVHRFAVRVPRTGRVVLPWPIGSALVMAPFYAIGWAVENARAAIAGTPPDSYGAVTQIAFALGSLFYGWLGMWMMLACVARVADRAVARVATLAAALGGPLVFYVLLHPTMAHASSFGLLSAMLVVWWRAWRDDAGHQGATPRRMAAMGLLLGVLVSVRYQNALFAILLAGVLARDGVRHRSARRLVVSSLAALGAAAPPVVLTYLHTRAMVAGADAATLAQIAQNPVDLRSPHFFEVLLSCRHGAFYWAPLVAVAFAGLVWALRREGWARVFALTFLAHAWLVGSLVGYLHWSGAASFGMRYLTECTPLLACGLAVVLAAARERAGWRWALAPTALLVAFNLALIVAYSLRRVDQIGCVTWPEMARGMARVATRAPPVSEPDLREAPRRR